MSLRFAVGQPAGLQSSSWKLWTQGDEAYCLQRGMGARHHKFSFHKSGNCRWAMIRPGMSGAERAMLQWQREPIPPTGSGQASLLLLIAFPTNHLSAPQTEERKGIRWIDPAPLGWAVMIEILMTTEDSGTIERSFDKSGERQLLYCQTLRNGMRLCAAASLFDCGPVNLNAPCTDAPGTVFGDLVFPDRDEENTGRPVRMIFMPSKDLPPTVWELGGYDGGKIKKALVPSLSDQNPSGFGPAQTG